MSPVDREAPIDREALVRRHTVRLTQPSPQHVLSVGNGDFAFTADATGMQTFRDHHDPLGAARRGAVAVNTATMSSWGWHEMPDPDGWTLADATSEHQTTRGPVPYADRSDLRAAMQGQLPDELRPGAWLSANPHRLDLGRIGLLLREHPAAEALSDPAGLSDPRQELDLWTGHLNSAFAYAGEPVSVVTTAAPEGSVVAFRITSPLLADGRLAVALRFPYAHDGFFQTSDWDADERHTSELEHAGPGRALVHRRLDATRYTVEVTASSAPGRAVTVESPGAHVVTVTGTGEELELIVGFAPVADDAADRVGPAPTVSAVETASADAWRRFWSSGGALDLSGSSDERAGELERRVVLSQYLTRVHCSGTLPPAETGLVTNSWSGKHHLEMHLWHAAHFATWGRPELLMRSLPWYRSILPAARATAAGQGYRGARWPKQTGPEGRESPDPIGAFLLWQQPHLPHLLELLWNALDGEARTRLVAENAEVVEATAEFMADVVEERDGAYHLLAPVMPAQEFYDVATTEDPTFELAAWWWGLEVAQRWRERLGGERHAGWSDVQARLALPAVRDGHYAAIATEPYLRRDDHPAHLMALGLLPATPLVDPQTMGATLDDVLAAWDWPSAWGWDFAVMAMTATRLGRPGDAVDALLRPEAKNTVTAVGHNPQMGAILPLYLPGNGALLAAVSLMATAGGFPGDGWSVRSEGLVPWPTTDAAPRARTPGQPPTTREDPR